MAVGVGVDDSSNKRPGSVVVTRPTSHGEVPGSNPGLVVLFSLTVGNKLER